MIRRHQTLTILLGIGFSQKGYQLSQRQKSVLITSLVILTAIWGYYQARPYIGNVPDIPEEFYILLKYGIGSRNILDTRAGSFTKDMIADPAITIELNLTQNEMETVWWNIYRNHFYELPEHIPENKAAGTSVVPHETFRLTVWAEGYGEKTVIFSDVSMGGYSLEERRILRITDKIIVFIESKPEYKAIAEPSGGYA
jgi:hypothetical protein